MIHDPIRGETFAATDDGPATLDGQPIVASVKDKLSDFVVSMALSGPALIRRARAVRKAIRVPRSMGSAALALAYVGNGRFDAFVQQGGLSSWDIAAAGLIAERAGATVTDLPAGRGSTCRASRSSIGVLAAPAAHHAGAARASSTADPAGPPARPPSARCAASDGAGRVLRQAQRGAERLPAGLRRAAPAQLVDVPLRDLDAVVGRPEPGQRAVQQHLVPALAERGGERRARRAGS